MNKLNKTQSGIFYLVGVIQTGFGPLTEFFTDDQNTESLQIWLNKFKRSFSDKTARRVYRVQSDYCWAQLLALSMIFNGMDIKYYLNKWWLFFYNGEKEFKRKVICAAHVAHTMSKKLKSWMIQL